MKSFTELYLHEGITNHLVTLASVKNDITNWGPSGRSVRAREIFTVWLDTEDMCDRYIFNIDITLNSRGTAPEKSRGLIVEISHLTGYDKSKRDYDITHPVKHLRISEDVKEFYISLLTLIEELEQYPEMSHPGTCFYRR